MFLGVINGAFLGGILIGGGGMGRGFFRCIVFKKKGGCEGLILIFLVAQGDGYSNRKVVFIGLIMWEFGNIFKALPER